MFDIYGGRRNPRVLSTRKNVRLMVFRISFICRLKGACLRNLSQSVFIYFHGYLVTAVSSHVCHVLILNMLAVKRGEANRTLVIIALVLVPIVLLFGILFLVLACSEYWSLHRQRLRRLCCFGQRHKRSRSDPSWGSSSTKQSDSSEGGADFYHRAVQLREHV